MNLESNFSGCNLFFYLLIITLGRLLSLSVSKFPFFFFQIEIIVVMWL